MKKTILLPLVALALCLGSCKSSQSALSDLRSLTYDIRDNGSTYTIKDWKKAGEKYQSINKAIVKHRSDYTQDELTEVGQLNGQCVGYFTKGVTTSVAGKATNALSVLKGIVDGVKGSIGIGSK